MLLILFPATFGISVSAAPSTLKVAICNPGSEPYANANANGSVVGFDAGNANFRCLIQLYPQLLTTCSFKYSRRLMESTVYGYASDGQIEFTPMDYTSSCQPNWDKSTKTTHVNIS